MVIIFNSWLYNLLWLIAPPLDFTSAPLIFIWVFLRPYIHNNHFTQSQTLWQTFPSLGQILKLDSSFPGKRIFETWMNTFALQDKHPQNFFSLCVVLFNTLIWLTSEKCAIESTIAMESTGPEKSVFSVVLL